MVQNGLQRSMFGVVLVTALCSLVVCALLTFYAGTAQLLCSIPDGFKLDACVSISDMAMFFRLVVVQHGDVTGERLPHP